MALHEMADLTARYRRFVERVVEEDEVWVLVGADHRGAWVESNQYAAADGEPVVVHLIYSAAAYARQHAVGEWAHMQPVAVSLDDFLDGPLLGMHEAGDLVGPDFNADLAGLEVRAGELALALLPEPDDENPDD